MNYQLPAEGKKNRVSFWGKLFGTSKKSANKEKNNDSSFGRHSTLYHSFHCTNVQQELPETQDDASNFTTLENSAFMEMHKDAGIIFLNKNPLANCMEQKEDDKRVHFVPTPQNKYYRVDVKSAPSRRLKYEESNKENLEQSNLSKPARPILRLGRSRESRAKKEDAQNMFDANKIKVNVSYVDGPQVKKTPVIPRTSTKIALLDPKNGSLPHLNVSGITKYGSLPRFAKFRDETNSQNDFHTSSYSENTMTKQYFPTVTNQQALISSDADSQGRFARKIDKSGRFSIPDLPRHAELNRSNLQLRSGSNQNIPHRLSIGDPLLYSRNIEMGSIPDCYGRSNAMQGPVGHQRLHSKPFQQYNGKTVVNDGVKQKLRIPASAISGTIDTFKKPGVNLPLPNRAINEVGLPLTAFKVDDKFLAHNQRSRSESPHYIPLAETFSSSCKLIQQKKSDAKNYYVQTHIPAGNGDFSKPIIPIQSNEFEKRFLKHEPNVLPPFRRDNSKIHQKNEVIDDSAEYSHFLNQARRQVSRSSMSNHKRKSFNKMCKYKSKECEDGFSSMADDECSFNCSCSSCVLRFSKDCRTSNKNYEQHNKEDKYFFICTDIKEENESEQVPEAILTGVNNQKDTVHEMENKPELSSNTSWYECNDSLCKTPKVDPYTPRNKNTTKSLLQNLKNDKLAESIYENITEIINSATKRNFKTKDVEQMFSTPLSNSKIQKRQTRQSGKVSRSLFSSREHLQGTKQVSPLVKSPVVFSDSVILLQEIFQKLSQECKELLQPGVSTAASHNPKAISVPGKSNPSGSKYVNDLVKNLRSSSAISEGDFANIIGGIAQNIFLEARLKLGTGCLTQSSSLPDLTRNIEEPEEVDTKSRSSLEDLRGFQLKNLDLTSAENVTDSGFKTGCDTRNETVESSNETNSAVPGGRDFPDGWSRTPTTSNNSTSSVIENSSTSKDDSRSSESDMQLLENAIRLGMGLSPIKKVPKATFYACSPTKASKFKSRDVLSCKGKLKLKIYHNSGLVTVHVIRGAKLQRINGRDLNPYIKLSMVPDTSKRVHWRTSVIKGQKSPVFNQKFSFEILEEDSLKRLVFSVWHRDFTKERSELVGCMSFSVRHVLDNTHKIDGWYRLLREGFGTQKHFAAHKKNSCPPKRLK